MLYEYDPYKVTTIRVRKTDLNILKDNFKKMYNIISIFGGILWKVLL